MLRIGFVTCVQLGLSCMHAIYEAGGELAFAMTLRDDVARQKSGRVHLDDFCLARHIPLTKIRNINDADAIQAISNARLDWLFIVGWSQIARREVLGATRKGVLGMHPTLLPLGRGRAAIPWAILLGLSETGVTLFQLDEGVDTGPIIAQTVVAVAERETATTLYSKLNEAHVQLLKENWEHLASDRMVATVQDHALATEWAGRKPEDGRLDPTMGVMAADRLVRAVTHPYPGAFMDLPEGRVRIWSGQPALVTTDVDPESRPTKRNARRIRFSDGWLDSDDWSLEP